MKNKVFAILLTGVCILLILARWFWPNLIIDSTTVALIVLAALPWLLPFLKTLELPGVKIEFRDIKAATDKITLQFESAGDQSDEVDFKSKLTIQDSLDHLEPIANQDPNLALVGFRIELEKRLRRLAETHKIDVSRMTMRGTVRKLQQQGILPARVADGIVELVALGNSAAHGAQVAPEASQWVSNVWPEIIEQLDAAGGAK
jgi:hypothetical protein